MPCDRPHHCRLLAGCGRGAARDCCRCSVERFDGQARRRLVARHEFGALLGRDHMVDIVEAAAAAFIDDVEQSEWAGARLRSTSCEIGPHSLAS